MILVNANISIKQIITINREYKLYLKINQILPVMHKYSKYWTPNDGHENIKYYGILKFYTSPKVNWFV